MQNIAFDIEFPTLARSRDRQSKRISKRGARYRPLSRKNRGKLAALARKTRKAKNHLTFEKRKAQILVL